MSEINKRKLIMPLTTASQGFLPGVTFPKPLPDLDAEFAIATFRLDVTI